jgi:GxxExxY protein
MTAPTGLYQQECHALMAAAFDVYNEMGNGFLKEVYHESLELELSQRGIPYDSMTRLSLYYKGQLLRKKYETDLILVGEIVVEVKAVKILGPEHEAQLVNYLHATGRQVGYLVNFGAFPELEWKRFIL